MEKGIGYTERTIALDAVIRHQELIIKSLNEEFEKDQNGIYKAKKWLFGTYTVTTAAGYHIQRMIGQFEKGLASLQEQLAEQVKSDIDSAQPCNPAPRSPAG